jgi:hypothetical protein
VDVKIPPFKKAIRDVASHQLVDAIGDAFSATIDAEPMTMPLVNTPLKLDDFIVVQVLLLAWNLDGIIAMTNTGLPLFLCLHFGDANLN